MSSLGSLSVAVSGMNAARMGLNVVGHNIANSTAPGYSRQRVLQNNFAYINASFATRANLTTMRGGVNMMQRGIGTDISSINQVRDMFIDISYRRELGRLGYHTPIADTGMEIQLLLSELQGAFPTQTVFNDIWEALNELSTNQSAIEVRANFISTAATFITKMNSVHAHLRVYQQNLNNQVKSTVVRINQLLEQIAQLNESIAREETHSRRDDRLFLGDNANDLRDRRNLALDELSNLLHITFREDERGHIEIRSGNSILLSSGNIVNRIGLKQAAPGSNLVMPIITNTREILPYDTDPTLFRQLFNLNDEISAYRGNDSGRLLGLLVARGLSMEDSYTPERLAQLVADLPALEAAYAAAIGGGFGPGDPIYDAALEALNANLNAQNRMRFNMETALIPRTMMHIDTLFNHVVTLINDAVSPWTFREVGTNNPITQAQIDAGTHIPQTQLNPITGLIEPIRFRHDEAMPFDNGNPPARNYLPVFVRGYTGGQPYLPRFIEDPVLGWILNEPEPHDLLNRRTLYTVGNVTVNPAFFRDGGSNKLALSLDSNAVDDTTLVNRLMDAWKDELVNFPGVQPRMSIDNAYRHLVSVLADDTNEALGFVQEQTTLVQFIDNKRQSIKGVSMDEELSFMLIFQHAYNANARMVNMLDSMLDTLINGLRSR